jgi:hypothetical protein
MFSESEANEDTDEGRAKIIEQREVDDEMFGAGLAEQTVSFVVGVANIVVAKLHEWSMRRKEKDIALELEGEDLPVSSGHSCWGSLG